MSWKWQLGSRIVGRARSQRCHKRRLGFHKAQVRWTDFPCSKSQDIRLRSQMRRYRPNLGSRLWQAMSKEWSYEYSSRRVACKSAFPSRSWHSSWSIGHQRLMIQARRHSRSRIRSARQLSSLQGLQSWRSLRRLIGQPRLSQLLEDHNQAVNWRKR